LEVPIMVADDGVVPAGACWPGAGLTKTGADLELYINSDEAAPVAAGGFSPAPELLSTAEGGGLLPRSQVKAPAR
jgi:hypothetical protein